jgi:hypothetical protein
LATSGRPSIEQQHDTSPGGKGRMGTEDYTRRIQQNAARKAHPASLLHRFSADHLLNKIACVPP